MNFACVRLLQSSWSVRRRRSSLSSALVSFVGMAPWGVVLVISHIGTVTKRTRAGI